MKNVLLYAVPNSSIDGGVSGMEYTVVDDFGGSCMT